MFRMFIDTTTKTTVKHNNATSANLPDGSITHKVTYIIETIGKIK